MTEVLTYVGIFVAVLAESTIILGSFVPGVNTVVVASFLASTGKLNVALVFASAWIGMFLGDNLGYMLGKYGLHRIPAADRWFQKARPRVEVFMEQRSHLVVLYQFVGAARSPLPILLGVIGRPLRQWLALLTAATSLFIGFLVGASYVLGRLLGKDKALKVAIITQTVIGLLFAVIIFRAISANKKRP